MPKSGPGRHTTVDTGGARYFLNVSPGVLSDPRFREFFTPERLKPYGISPNMIVLELTENLPVEDYGKLEESVAWFRKEGFSLALDDVGSGYSGLRTMAVSAPDFSRSTWKSSGGWRETHTRSMWSGFSVRLQRLSVQKLSPREWRTGMI